MGEMPQRDESFQEGSLSWKAKFTGISKQINRTKCTFYMVEALVKPFENIFGDTSELRVIQFLLPMKNYEFNISELAEGADVSRQALNRVVKKLLKWNVLKITSKHLNANYYSLNPNSGFVEVFENLNNRIIEQILGEEKLEEIAKYSLERHIQMQPIEPASVSCVDQWAGTAGGLQDDWSQIAFEIREEHATA